MTVIDSSDRAVMDRSNQQILMPFKVGDIVEIISVQEYRKKGFNCTDDCAIAAYTGTKCVICSSKVCRNKDGSVISIYALNPIGEVNIDEARFPYINNISDYEWSENELRLYTTSSVADDEYFNVLLRL